MPLTFTLSDESIKLIARARAVDTAGTVRSAWVSVMRDLEAEKRRRQGLDAEILRHPCMDLYEGKDD